MKTNGKAKNKKHNHIDNDVKCHKFDFFSQNSLKVI